MGFRFPNAHDAELHLTQTAGNNIVTNQGFDAATWHPWAADLPPQPICPREPKGGRGGGPPWSTTELVNRPPSKASAPCLAGASKPGGHACGSRRLKRVLRPSRAHAPGHTPPARTLAGPSAVEGRAAVGGGAS